jgi:1-aminocyclopropane-1-carboxylate deaminase/D-cysteine desulfhydrase-like pyridoxal-dependent ACC family enzyme
MVFASSSGGTHAGLAAGARLAGYGGQVLGISIDAEAEILRERVARLANATLELLDPAARPGRLPAQAGREASSSDLPGTPRARVAPADIAVNANYLGEGYGLMGPPERQAIRLFAETEGLLIDPVYTGRAAAGLIDLIRRGAFRRDETILFWHTGGTAALYAYADQLLA